MYLKPSTPGYVKYVRIHQDTCMDHVSCARLTQYMCAHKIHFRIHQDTQVVMYPGACDALTALGALG